jgi:integrase
MSRIAVLHAMFVPKFLERTPAVRQISCAHLQEFRHTNSTLMDCLGVPLKVRQQRLGHSDSSLTLDVYTHVASEDDVRVAEQMGGILRPKRRTAQEWSLLSRCSQFENGRGGQI